MARVTVKDLRKKLNSGKRAGLVDVHSKHITYRGRRVHTILFSNSFRVQYLDFCGASFASWYNVAKVDNRNRFLGR